MTSAVKHPVSSTMCETGEMEIVPGSAHENYPVGTEFSTDDQPLSQSPTWATTTALMVESNPLSTEAALLGGLLLVLIALAAIIGNVLVILSVYKNRKLRTVTNLFVVSLAVADLMVGALVLPFAIKQEVTQSWELGSTTCDVWISLDVLLCTASILNLCCISIDRYFAVTSPLVCATKRSRRRASVMIAVVWCLSAVITSPPLFGLRQKNQPINGGMCHLTKEAGYVVYSAMGSFYIPLAIMLFVYVNIFVVARRAQRRWRSKTGKSLSLCSGASRTPSFPTAASELPSATGSEDRRGAVRVSSRSSWFCCCCVSGGQWTVTVSEVTDWPMVPHGHLRLHVLRSEAGIVNNYGGTQFNDRSEMDCPRTPEVINGARLSSGSRMTSEIPKRDSGANDVIVGSNVGQRESCSKDMELFLRVSNKSPDKVSGRCYSSVESLTCAHACSDSGNTAERGKTWCGCGLHHSQSRGTRAPSSSCHEVNTTRGRMEEIKIEKSNVFVTTETKTRSTEFVISKDRFRPPLNSGTTSNRTQDGSPDSVGGRRGLLSQGAASSQVSVNPRRELRQSQRGRTPTQDRRENTSAALREGKTAKTVSIVIGCFVLCWLPFFVVYVAEPFFPSGTFDETMTKFFVWLGYFNSVINPFIYAFYNSDFRFTFWQLTLGRVRRRGATNRVPGMAVAPSTPNIRG